MLELDRVSKVYASGPASVHALRDVSLTVGRGEFIAVYGPSGSGKTTLLLVAAGIVRPDAGAVRFDGQDLTAMSEREATAHRLRSVGIVFQSVQLFGGASALDNAGIKLFGGGASRREARRAARPWLDRVGLTARRSHLPAQLSTGERQRVAIARALANDPALVLADEPTGNLDTESGHGVLSLLAGICHERGVGVVLATHDPAALEFADRAYVVRDGRLAEQTTERETIARPAVAR